MHKKRIIYLVLLFLLQSISSLAVNITVGGSTVFLSDELTPLSSGSYISVGYFDSNFTDFNNLDSQEWSEINQPSVYTELFNSRINPVNDGELSGSANVENIDGEKLHIWIFDSPTEPSLVNGQEYGLFTGSDSDWIAKGDSILPPEFNNLTVGLIDNAIFGTDLGADIALAVPEPSTYAFLISVLILGYSITRRFRIEEA